MQVTIDIDAETFAELSSLGEPADVLSAFAKTVTGRHAVQDQLILEQREANAHMVGATLEARDARLRAEEGERAQLRVAEFREQFIGILGHDLRTPLGAISLAAEAMVHRGRLAEQDSATVGRILRCTERMTRMVSQLLDLARARAGGGLPVRPTPADLGEVCRAVVEEFEVPVRVELDDDLTGTWDVDRLAELISNLVRNAIEHAHPGTMVDLRTFAEPPAVVIEVTNTGAPIPTDLLRSLFEPFRQGKHSTPADNLGLGLYIARQIVIAHGGTIVGRSNEGRTTFTARLPRVTPADAAPTSSSA